LIRCLLFKKTNVLSLADQNEIRIASLNMKRYFWTRPHPFIFTPTSIVVPGLLTILVIFLLSPFNFDSLSLQNRLITALISAFIVSFSIGLVVYGMMRFFPKWTKAENWTVGKEILLFISVVFCIATLHFVMYALKGTNIGLTVLFQKVFLRTVLMSTFPIIGLVLIEQYIHRTQQLKRALEMNKALRSVQDPKEKLQEDTPQMIWFLGENGKAVCQLNPEKIQFIKADGNYIEIHVLHESLESKKQVIRNKLSEVEKTLPGEYFWRVHRSYLANLQQIETVTGNARDLVLVMKKSQERVPVSRAKAKRLLEEITNRSHSSQTAPKHTK